MLVEVSRDLLALRHSIVPSRRRAEVGEEGGGNGGGGGGGGGDDVAGSAPAGDGRAESGQDDTVRGECDEDDDGGGGGGEGGTVERIDLVVEKIQGALAAIVGTTTTHPLNEEEGRGRGMIPPNDNDGQDGGGSAPLERRTFFEDAPVQSESVPTPRGIGPAEERRSQQEHDGAGSTLLDGTTQTRGHEQGQLGDEQKMQPNDDDAGNLDEGGGNSDDGTSTVGGGVTIESASTDEAPAPISPATTPNVVPGEDTSQKDLDDALRTLSNNNDAKDLKVGAQMLYLYCRNISRNPSVPRYRKIYTNNANFRNKVGNLAGARDFLVAVGFVERPASNMFEWSHSLSSPRTNDDDDDDDDDAGGSWVTRSKLDFALVALELMKNGGAAVGGGDGIERVNV
jgi:hypothetical protein